MLFLKIIYHLKSKIFKWIFLIIYYGKLSINKNTTWRNSINFMISKNGYLKIGKNCFFNNNCSINVQKKVTIGNNNLFGECVKIYDHNHVFNKKNTLIKKQGFSSDIVTIGDNCWFGSNVIVLKGTNIGNNCVIGAGCIISGIVPDNTIVKSNRNNIFEKINFK